MLVGFIHRQKPAGRRNDTQPVARLGPIHHARAHLAVALDRHVKKASVQRAGGQRIGPLVTRMVGPKKRNELAGLEIDVVAVRPFQVERLGIRQLGDDRFNQHFDHWFGHKECPSV